MVFDKDCAGEILATVLGECRGANVAHFTPSELMERNERLKEREFAQVEYHVQQCVEQGFFIFHKSGENICGQYMVEDISDTGRAFLIEYLKESGKWEQPK